MASYLVFIDMRKNLLTCLFLFSLVLCAQAQKKHFQLSGNIKNYASQELSITIESFWKYAEDNKWLKTQTDEKGNFSFEVPFEGYPVRYVSFSDKKNNVFGSIIIEPTDEIKIHYDHLNFPKTLKVSGKEAWKITYAQMERKMFDEYERHSPLKPAIHPEQHVKLNDSLNTVLFERLRKNEVKASPLFQQLYYADMVGLVIPWYPNGYEIKALKLDNSEEVENQYDSISLARYLAYAPKQDKNLVYSQGYSMFISNLFNRLTNTLGKQVGKLKYQDNEWHNQIYYLYKSMLLPPLAEKIIGLNILESIGMGGLSKDQALMQDYLNSYPKSPYANKVQETLEALIANQAGKPAFDFEAETENGTKIKLSDFKGKTVLLDFGASWCRGCRESHPTVKQIAKNLEDDDFVVFAVSVTDDKLDWFDYVKRTELSQKNIIAVWVDDKKTELLRTKYGFSAVPHKTLIDKKGLIAEWDEDHFNKDNAEEMQQKIETLMKK